MMSKTRILVIVLSIAAISKPDAAVQSKKRSEISPSVMNGIKSTGEAVGAKLTELFLNRYLPENSFTILITNSMVKRRLIDPKIYLKNGKTNTPPSFMIPAAQDPYSGTKHIALLENDPAGVLCYDNEPSTAQPNVEKAVSCVILDAKKKQYALYAQHEAITLNGMKTLYEKYKKRSDESIAPTINENGGFLFKDYQQFKMIAQLTTGGKVRQLHFEVLGSIASTKSALRKKVLIALGGSLLLGGLSTLGTFAFNRITADVGTTLTLENLSTGKTPIVLEEPRWEQNGVEIRDIVPWRLASKDTCKISFVGPFGAGERRSERSAIALSFQIQGTNDRLVLSIWWPKKIRDSLKANSYSVSLLPFPVSKDRDYENLTHSLQSLVRKASKDRKEFPTPVVQVNEFQSYKIWQFPITNPETSKVDKILNVLTNMGNARNNGMTVKVYTTIPDSSKNRPSNTIPGPKVYSELGNKIPLV